MSTTDNSAILVIDDDELVLAVIRKLLQSEKYTVSIAQSGREGLAQLAERQFSAILCDMWMPGMTGKDFYDAIKANFPQYKSKILFLTGDVVSSATWDFIEQHRLPYVLKPLSLPELRRKVQEITGHKPPPETARGGDLRRYRRVAVKGSARVTNRQCATNGPDLAPVKNASKAGLYITTVRQYRVGDELLVAFPYTGSNDIDQSGVVVRVDERDEGRRCVAVALGEAAAKAREAFRKREEQVSSEPPPFAVRLAHRDDSDESAAELRVRLVQEREQTRRLAQQLAEMKAASGRSRPEPSRGTPPITLAKPTAAPQSEVTDSARLSEEVADLRHHMHEMRKNGLGALRMLSAYCAMLDATKSLDESTKRIVQEMSQQAALLRTAFRKHLKKV